MASISPVQVPGTPRPRGHYSQAVVHDGVAYVAGQLPVDLDTGRVVPGTIEAQTRRVLENTGRILREAGSGLEHLLQVTLYVARIDAWDAIDAAYASVLGTHRPARVYVPLPALPSGVGIEVAAIAAVPPRPRKRSAQRGAGTGTARSGGSARQAKAGGRAVRRAAATSSRKTAPKTGRKTARRPTRSGR